jgi:hypothetical protein
MGINFNDRIRQNAYLQTNNINFYSDLTTRSVQSDAELPTCKYSVHRDSPNGPMIQYSKIGEVLFHVWSCKSDMYKMLLTNCKVVDGKGTEFQLIDANGCSQDEYLFPQITYSDDVTTVN